MSFILKALKKLEEEKATQAMEPVDLNSALLSTEPHPPSWHYRTGKWLVASLAFFAGIGATYFFLQKPAASAVQRVPATVTQASPPAPVPLSQTITAADKTEPVRPPVSSSASAGSRGPISHPKLREMTTEMDSPRHSAPATFHPRQQENASPGEASLKVSGIGFQDDPAQSMAVVNGALVKTGMTVGGAQVERIFPDKVRFKGSDGSFDVKLTK